MTRAERIAAETMAKALGQMLGRDELLRVIDEPAPAPPDESIGMAVMAAGETIWSRTYTDDETPLSRADLLECCTAIERIIERRQRQAKKR